MDGQHVAEIGAEHHEDALRDVDDVEHAEDQREPGRHQRVDPAAEYAGGDGLLNLGRHLSSVLPSVPAVSSTSWAWGREPAPSLPR